MNKVQKAAFSTDDQFPKREPSRSPSLYLEDTLRDIRLSCRTLSRSPVFTAVVIVTLALGIGVNTAVFTLFDVVSLRPMMVPDPHQIVDVYSGSREYPCCNPFSFPDYLDFRETNQVFSGLIAYSPLGVHLSADGFTERLTGELVSANYTDVLGIEPIIGRGFLAIEDQVPSRYPVAMISNRLWQEWFNARHEKERSFNFLLVAFSILALILASVGLYGVLSHSMARRTREMAVRMAMGARRAHTVRLALGRAMVVVGIGLSIGIGAALGLTRLIGHYLYEVDPADPKTFLVATLVVVAASLLACWVPAYRITRLEPVEALRHE